jgi:KaiC/GvpD/RAD55 family RecA-like ATPase
MKLSDLYTILCKITWDQNGKKTALFLENWKNPTKKSIEKIQEHFKLPGAGIGIATGKINGITVIDFDSMDNELIMELYEIAPTYCVQTTKGIHFYYKYHPYFKQGTNRFKGSVDVRNEGGLIFAPPTPNYKRWGERSIGEITPEALELLKKYEMESYQQNIVSTETRNDTLFRKMCGWLSYYDDQEAWNRSVKANKEFCKGELTDGELETMFQSAKKYPAQGKKTTVDNQLAQIKKEESLSIGTLSIDKREKRYTWGTKKLDNEIVILKRGNLVVLGAKRNMGKTTFTFDMAVKNAKLGHRVLYISLEMEKSDIVEALARKHAGITVEEEYNYKIPEYKRTKMLKKLEDIKNTPTLIFESARRAEGIIFETVKKIMEDNPADIVFIDNLDCISGNKGEDNNERQKRIITSLMNYTTVKKIPVIMIHHYRKSNKQSSGMDEMAGSGKVADAADIIINLSRKSVEESLAAGVQYPETNKTVLWVQKGRGYDDKAMEIYFIDGTFCDYNDISNLNSLQRAQNVFGGVIHN